jgi:hypothetical protein
MWSSKINLIEETNQNSCSSITDIYGHVCTKYTTIVSRRLISTLYYSLSFDHPVHQVRDAPSRVTEWETGDDAGGSGGGEASAADAMSSASAIGGGAVAERKRRCAFAFRKPFAKVPVMPALKLLVEVQWLVPSASGGENDDGQTQVWRLSETRVHQYPSPNSIQALHKSIHFHLSKDQFGLNTSCIFLL